MHFTTALPIIAGIASAAAATERVFFPDPSGEYHVGKTQHIIPHKTPHDPVAPKKWHGTGKLILLTIHYPTTQAPTPATSLKYLDHTLAHRIESQWGFPDGSLQKLWTPIQWQPPMLSGSVGENPLLTLLFLPGLGTTCSCSTMMQAEMASRGYTVLCLDHPGEMPYLKLPYGRGGLAGLPINYPFTDIDVALQVQENRKRDVDALLKVYPQLVQELKAPWNTSTYIHYGFSAGGSTGTYVVAEYESVLGGVDYDGSLFDFFRGAEGQDVKKPFLLFRDAQIPPHGDDTWDAFEAKQTGWWEYLQVKHSHHVNFCDLGYWFELLGLKHSEVEEPAGKITGSRMNRIQVAFTTAFFDKVLGKKECLLLEKDLPDEEWPDVVFVNSSFVNRGV